MFFFELPERFISDIGSYTSQEDATMPNCNACGNGGASYKIRNPKGGFHPETFCKKCKDRLVTAIRKAGGKLELNVAIKNFHALGAGIATIKGNPVKPWSKARFDRHRQAPPECFFTRTFRTVPIRHTSYPRNAPYNVKGALAGVGRIKKPCAAKYAERGVRVKYRAWAIQSILTPKDAGLRPTKSEMALENPSVIYTVTKANVRKFGSPFDAMTLWARKHIGPNPKISKLFSDGKTENENPDIYRMFKKEKLEHPTLSDEDIMRIVQDHIAAGHNPKDMWVEKVKGGYVGYADGGNFFTGVRETREAAMKDLREGLKRHNPVQMSLPVEQAIYVPSTDEGNRPISKTELDSRVHETKEHLSNLFGGYTTTEAIGGYHSPTKGLVEEPVVKVTSFTTKENYDANRFILQEWLSLRAKLWGQESIGYEVEGDLMYMNPDANRHYTSKERRAITSSPEFKEWLAARRVTHLPTPKQGAFHAFMTDVGKRSGHRKEKEWEADPSRADRRAPPIDAPTMKKYYHGLGKNPPSYKDKEFEIMMDVQEIVKHHSWTEDVPSVRGFHASANTKLITLRNDERRMFTRKYPDVAELIRTPRKGWTHALFHRVDKNLERFDREYGTEQNPAPKPSRNIPTSFPGDMKQFKGEWL